MTDSGNRNFGICVRIIPPLFASPSKTTHSYPSGVEIARDGERCGTGADERDALAVALVGTRRQAVADVVLVVGGDALQPADGDGLGLALAVTALLDAAPATGGLAWAVAGTPENPGKDIRFPVDEVRVAIATRRDQANVLGNRGVGGARPLAIDDLVEIVGIGDIRRLQTLFLQWARQVLVLTVARQARFAPDPCSQGRILRLGRPREKACWGCGLPPPTATAMLQCASHRITPALRCK